MKRGIITPTFRPHFKFILKYLDSAIKYISDPENITFFFTVSERDVSELSELLKKYRQILNIRILCFDEIIEKYKIPYSDEKLLSKYGKFSYQTLKKFYSMLESECEQMLVLDSESMFVNRTNINDLFDDFFKSPFITVCSLDAMTQVGSFKAKVMENISFILDNKNESENNIFSSEKLSMYEKNNSSLKDIWFLENFVWFYDRTILNDMFRNLGEPFDIIDSLYINSSKENKEQGCFEICLYQGFIYKNKTFNYNILHVEDIISDIFRDNLKLYSEYKKFYYGLWNGEFGLIEMAMAILTDKSSSLFANSLRKYKFSIVRCDFTNLNNYNAQKLFLNILRPNILAASQNHVWGVNNTYKNKIWLLLVFNNPFARYIYSDIKNILSPIKPFLVWVRYFYYLTKHSCLWLQGLLKNFNLLKK